MAFGEDARGGNRYTLDRRETLKAAAGASDIPTGMLPHTATP
jgi:hypothetical protein